MPEKPALDSNCRVFKRSQSAVSRVEVVGAQAVVWGMR